jgi:hypothetical protein
MPRVTIRTDSRPVVRVYERHDGVDRDPALRHGPYHVPDHLDADPAGQRLRLGPRGDRRPGRHREEHDQRLGYQRRQRLPGVLLGDLRPAVQDHRHLAQRLRESRHELGTQRNDRPAGHAPAGQGTRHQGAQRHQGHPKGATTHPDTTVSGPGSGAFVSFDTSKNRTVNVRVGLSYVSVANAAANARAEQGSKSFDTIRAAARAAWNDRLGQIQVTGGTADQKTVFDTELYHSLLQPNVFSDADGRYIGFDGQTHNVAKGHAQYANFSGWDI